LLIKELEKDHSLVAAKALNQFDKQSVLDATKGKNFTS
jgi:hypothetical protein